MLFSILVAANPVAAAPNPERLPGHVLPALAKAVRAAPASTAATQGQLLSLTLVLKRDDEAGFQQYLHDVYDPASPIFRQFLTQAQLADRFGPSPSDYQQVLDYLQTQGFTLTEGSTNRMTLTVSGSRTQVEQAFGVHIDDYKIGTTVFHANDTDPSLPPDIDTRVQAIAGLSNLAVPQPMVQGWPGGPGGQATWYALCANYAINGGPINAGIGSGLFYANVFQKAVLAEYIVVLNLLDSAVNILQAADLSSSGTGQQYLTCVNSYNATHGLPALGRAAPLPTAASSTASAFSLAGAGQRVGLLEFDTYLPSDVRDYAALMGPWSGPASNVSEIHVNGGAPLGAGQSEVLLDIADVLTAAPGASIVVFDAPQSTSYQTLFNAMLSQGVTVISNSWAYCEDQTTQADVASIDSILQMAAASGVSVFSGAGDSGSTCLDGSPNTAAVPADSPHVTAVGGTTLQQLPGFTYGSETWWDGSGTSPPTGQGGFGVSRFFARPSWQTGSTSSPMRSIPDVSANADPRYGIVICQASAGGCPTGGFYGGTSSATPTWAAWAALLNQAHGSNLGLLNPPLYALANTNAFHNAASMGTDFAHVGLGSPNLARLTMGLNSQVSGPVSPSVSTVQAFAQTTFHWPIGSSLPILAFADGLDQTFVVVTLMDANGNPVGGKNVTLTATSGGITVFTGSGATDADSGVAIFYVKDNTPQTLTISATDTTDSIALAQKATIEYMPPPATGGGIVAFTDAVPADGKSTDTITVTLQDAQGRPSPGKQVALSQAGNSVISAPSPAVTNASGQIAFTVTDTVQEVVTYTATDVTDGNLPVPGSAVVTFNAGGSDNCGSSNFGDPNITAAPGYAITPYAIGFLPKQIAAGGLSSQCRGAYGLAFDAAGNLFVSDAAYGNIYKFPPGGGVVGAGTKLTSTPLGPLLAGLTFGQDGKFYAAQIATTGNFFTGAVMEVNSTTGANVRMVASAITCASFLTTDPVSGDLFVDDSCGGGGSNNPSIWRIANPGSATPTTSVYATTSGTNGGLAFAPGGTLYAIDYYGTGLSKIAGTGAATPGQRTQLNGVVSPALDIVALGAQANGDAKTLVLGTNAVNGGLPAGMKIFDATTTPITPKTMLVNNAFATVDLLGPDGCLYAGMITTVYKITNADGSCPLNVNQPALALSPAVVTPNPTQGGAQSFTATFQNVSVPAGTPVFFRVTGANAQTKLVYANASGVASFNENGVNAGSDTIVASATVGSATLTSNPAQVIWNAGPHTTFISFNSTPAGGPAGAPATLAAALFDVSVVPNLPIAGATLQFTVGGQSCNGTTNASGVVTCKVTIPGIGAFTLTAQYAGSSSYLPAMQSQMFTTNDLIFANGFEPLL
ncbi:MAG: Ig-like domain-containing protein [Proteobacteria bacterium]|nr:Ig-like domain-containing protein [Pseudomonadota bacterium]